MKVYTLDEVATLLKLSTQTVRKLIEKDYIKKLDSVGSIRITEKSLLEYLERS